MHKTKNSVSVNIQLGIAMLTQYTRIRVDVTTTAIKYNTYFYIDTTRSH